MKRKARTRKAAVTAGGTRSQRGSHGDGSPAGTRAFFRRGALHVVPGFDAFISNAFDEDFIRGDHNDNVDAITSDFDWPSQADRVNDPTLPASQQIIDVEAKP